MKTIICDSNTKFNKFYLKNLFTNELEKCTEKEFDETVDKFANTDILVKDANGHWRRKDLL